MALGHCWVFPSCWGYGKFLSLRVTCGRTQRGWHCWLVSFSGSSCSASHVYRATTQSENQMKFTARCQGEYATSLTTEVGLNPRTIPQRRQDKEDLDHKVACFSVNFSNGSQQEEQWQDEWVPLFRQKPESTKIHSQITVPSPSPPLPQEHDKTRTPRPTFARDKALGEELWTTKHLLESQRLKGNHWNQNRMINPYLRFSWPTRPKRVGVREGMHIRKIRLIVEKQNNHILSALLLTEWVNMPFCCNS